MSSGRLQAGDTLDIQMMRFIDKASVTIIGRRLEAEEYNSLEKQLSGLSSEQEKKEFLVGMLMRSPEFYVNIEEQLREDLLEGISRAELRNIYLKDFYFLTETRSQSIMHPAFEKTFKQLYKLSSIQEGKVDSTIDIQSLKRILVDNFIYDQINMGVDNFIISTFQHFVKRKPTVAELKEAKVILSGQVGVLFQKMGNCKEDYLSILLDSPSHWEAEIVYWYQKIYNQKPSEEVVLKLMNLMFEEKASEHLLFYLLTGK